MRQDQLVAYFPARY